jgi:homoaconitase/3-isopropylmalate dehydratase large subunit
MGKTLFHKVWDRHAVAKLPDGSTQLFIGTHLIHEVTSPQAFGMLRDLGLKVAFPKRTFATVDHIVPTDQRVEPFKDTLADAMIKELRKNCEDFGVTFFDRHHPTWHHHRMRRLPHLNPRCLWCRGIWNRYKPSPGRPCNTDDGSLPLESSKD